MKAELSSFDFHFLVSEFQSVIGGKINQIYQVEKSEIILDLHVPSKGKHFLRVLIGKILYLASAKGKTPQNPPGFCLFLRRYIRNARIREVNQLSFDRIIDFTLEMKDKKFHLIFELFSKGNVILCEEDYKIINPLEFQKRKNGIIKKGEQYTYPKKDYDFLKISKEDLQKIINTSDKESLVKTLAIDLGLGGVYSEEICLISKIDKSIKSNSLSNKQIDSLFKGIEKMRLQKVEPQLILKNNKPKDITPFELNFYKDQESIVFDSLSLAIDSILTVDTDDTHIEESKSTAKSKLGRIQEVVQTQEQRIKGLEKSSEENQKKGETIYENYQLISDLLDQIQKARKTMSWKEINTKLKGHKLIKSINEKTKEITIDL